jgi:hypothetical protein
MVSAATAAFSAYPFIFKPDNIANLKPKDYILLKGIVADDRHFMPYEVLKEATMGHISPNDYLGTICMMLVNTAYESVRLRNDHSAEFEFLRHVRNASSHLNRFCFSKGEPRRAASWHGITLDHLRRGEDNPLHNTHCFGKLLGCADVFLLLWDIEQIIIKADKAAATTGGTSLAVAN